MDTDIIFVVITVIGMLTLIWCSWGFMAWLTAWTLGLITDDPSVFDDTKIASEFGSR